MILKGSLLTLLTNIKMIVNHPSGNVKEMIGFMNLEFMRKIRANDMNLYITDEEGVFNTKALFKITWKESIELKVPKIKS